MISLVQLRLLSCRGHAVAWLTCHTCVSVQGVGADRCLHIRPPQERQEADGDAGKPAHGHRRISPHVREVWNWCQEEGGRFWGYSQVRRCP